MRLEIYNDNILEYDMLSAGISVAAEKDLISEDIYEDLIEADKTERTVLFGMALRDRMNASKDDKNIVKVINDGIREYVDIFIKENNISDEKVIEIAKDAIFLKSTKINKVRFGNYILFRCKGHYSYMLGFPASEHSKIFIKLYKESDRIKCRGAQIKYDHPCYDMFYELFYYIINKNPVQWNKVYSKFKKRLELCEDNLLSNVDNKYLIKVLLEASNEV